MTSDSSYKLERSKRRYLGIIRYIELTKRSGKIKRLTRSQINALKYRLGRCLVIIRKYLKPAALATGICAIQTMDVDAQCRMNRLPISNQSSFSIFGGSYYSLGNGCTPTFADLDNDGDYDLIVSEFSGRISHYENDNGYFKRSYGDVNPIQTGQFLVGYGPQLGFVDIDNDGDLDAFIGLTGGTIKYFRNDNYILKEVSGSSNPFDNINIGANPAPVFFDVNQDNDPDVLFGVNNGTIRYFKNNNRDFEEVSGIDNPFDGVDVGLNSSPSIVDIDKDGDQDVFIRGSTGIHYFKNDNGVFNEMSGVNNPLDGLQSIGAPGFVDIDTDGDYDVFLGSADRTNRFFRNDNGVFNQVDPMGVPFFGVDVGSHASPTWGDLEGDGDDDIVVGTGAGTIKTFINTNGEYNEVTEGSNPFNGISVGSDAKPVLVDIDPTDSDTDLDLVVGNGVGKIQYYRNNNGVFVELIGFLNPLASVNVGSSAAPTFVDFDGDNDKDAFIGAGDGTIRLYRNNNGVFNEVVGGSNPFNGINVGDNAVPYIFRFNASQALVGNRDGDIAEFKKVGNQYVPQTDSPYQGVFVGSFPSPMIIDQRTIIGNGEGKLFVFRDQGGRSNVWDGPFYQSLAWITK